jgi:O-antigen ligase
METNPRRAFGPRVQLAIVHVTVARRISAKYLLPVALGAWASTIALVPSLATRLALTAILPLGALVWWLLLNPEAWITVFFVCVFLTPPLPIPLGDAGVHIGPFVAALGVLTALVWHRVWRPIAHPVTFAFALFLVVLLVSSGLAAIYSGAAIGLGSFARVVLFSIGVFVFLYSYAGPARPALQTSRLLFGLATAGALFACFDFYYQLPAPAGYGDQFVWLDEGVLRRAQGLFYEASTLGNVCAFFLVMVAVALFRKREESPWGKRALLFGGLALATALMFSYSRASVFNVVVALAVLAWLRRRQLRRTFVWMVVALGTTIVGVRYLFPSFSANYWGRLLGSFSFFAETPDKILSGRLGHWQFLLDFLAKSPWHLLLGVGYKTLPYSNFTGGTVVADNTYLGLLVETGIVGIAAFAILNVAILRTGWRALRSSNTTARFLGEWIFCFWCGEIVQMFSGDLITYWRALPIYFWVLGAAARYTGEISAK